MPNTVPHSPTHALSHCTSQLWNHGFTFYLGHGCRSFVSSCFHVYALKWADPHTRDSYNEIHILRKHKPWAAIACRFKTFLYYKHDMASLLLWRHNSR